MIIGRANQVAAAVVQFIHRESHTKYNGTEPGTLRWGTENSGSGTFLHILARRIGHFACNSNNIQRTQRSLAKAAASLTVKHSKNAPCAFHGTAAVISRIRPYWTGSAGSVEARELLRASGYVLKSSCRICSKL